MIIIKIAAILTKIQSVSRVEIRFSLLNDSQLTSRMRASISQQRLRKKPTLLYA